MNAILKGKSHALRQHQSNRWQRSPECGAKTELIRGVTELLSRVLNKNPETTVVVIDEIDMDNWGIGGKSVTVRRAEARNK